MPQLAEMVLHWKNSSIGAGHIRADPIIFLSFIGPKTIQIGLARPRILPVFHHNSAEMKLTRVVMNAVGVNLWNTGGRFVLEFAVEHKNQGNVFNICTAARFTRQ